jgi:hypothetical protein
MPAGSGENKQLAPVLTHFPSTVPNMTPITIQGKKKKQFLHYFLFRIHPSLHRWNALLNSVIMCIMQLKAYSSDAEKPA